MKFKRIKLKNIRSYKDEEISFPEGSILLSGDVGSGKTSILLAIEYALFGLQPGQKGAALLRNNEELGEVELEIELGGKSVLIERKLKRTTKGVSNESASITIEGEKTESSVTEIKSKVVSLLGYPPEFVKKNNILYRYTVHTAQEQMKQIILEDAETRVNILRHVFGIDKYRQIKSNLSILTLELKSDIKILQGKIMNLEKDKENLELRKSSIKEIENKIILCKLELKDKTQKRNIAESEISELNLKLEEKRRFESEIEKTKIHLATKHEILSSTNRELEELNMTLSESKEHFNEENYNALLNRISSKKEKLSELNTLNINKMASYNRLEQETAEILSKKERIFRIDICPTCLQDVSENHKHNIMNETENKLSKIKTNMQILEEEKKSILEEIQNHGKELESLESEKTRLEILKSKVAHLERARAKIKLLELQKQNLEKDLQLLINHIDEMKERILKYSTFDSQYKKKEVELRNAISEEKKSEISLAELEKELEISHKEIKFFEESIREKENSKKQLYRINELIDWLSSDFLRLVEMTERNVLLKLRKEFSELFRKWFLMLISENSLDSEIDENFTPVILQGETEMDYNYLSGGERTAVALAYRLALNQTINSLMSKIKTRGLIILDEPTDGFSEPQIIKIRDILEEINAEQLIIVSHEQKIEGFVDNVIKISRDGESSTVEAAQKG